MGLNRRKTDYQKRGERGILPPGYPEGMTRHPTFMTPEERATCLDLIEGWIEEGKTLRRFDEKLLHSLRVIEGKEEPDKDGRPLGMRISGYKALILARAITHEVRKKHPLCDPVRSTDLKHRKPINWRVERAGAPRDVMMTINVRLVDEDGEPTGTVTLTARATPRKLHMHWFTLVWADDYNAEIVRNPDKLTKKEIREQYPEEVWRYWNDYALKWMQRNAMHRGEGFKHDDS